MHLLLHPFTRERNKAKKKTKTQKKTENAKKKKTQKSQNAYFQERIRIFSRTRTQKTKTKTQILGERCQLSSGEYCIYTFILSYCKFIINCYLGNRCADLFKINLLGINQLCRPTKQCHNIYVVHFVHDTICELPLRSYTHEAHLFKETSTYSYLYSYSERQLNVYSPFRLRLYVF